MFNKILQNSIFEQKKHNINFSNEKVYVKRKITNLKARLIASKRERSLPKQSHFLNNIYYSRISSSSFLFLLGFAVLLGLGFLFHFISQQNVQISSLAGNLQQIMNDVANLQSQNAALLESIEQKQQKIQALEELLLSAQHTNINSTLLSGIENNSATSYIKVGGVVLVSVLGFALAYTLVPSISNVAHVSKVVVTAIKYFIPYFNNMKEYTQFDHVHHFTWRVQVINEEHLNILFKSGLGENFVKASEYVNMLHEKAGITALTTSTNLASNAAEVTLVSESLRGLL